MGIGNLVCYRMHALHNLSDDDFILFLFYFILFYFILYQQLELPEARS
jgi:hypothetical protein